MLLWMILVLGWIAILVLALWIFRLAGYAERKMRSLARSAKPPEDRAA